MGITRKQESSRKITTSALLTTPKPLTVWIITNWKILKRGEYQTTLPAFWEICIEVKKQQLESNMEQQTVQIGKGVCQDCILSPFLFSSYAEYIMQNARLGEAQGGIKIADNLRYTDGTYLLMAENEEELKSLLMKVKEKSEKAGLKVNIQKTKIRAWGPIASWHINGETVETVTDFIFGGLQNHYR